MSLKSVLTLGAVAAVAPFVYDRVQFLSTLRKNDPATIPHVQTFKSHEVKFKDRIKNCEDVLLVEDKGLAILSCDPGRDKWNTVMGTFTYNETIPVGGLWIYKYADPSLPPATALQPIQLYNYPQGAHEFHPLGIEFHEPSSRLYVVNHHSNGTRLDIFSLSFPSTDNFAPKATYQKTILNPSLLATPNSIAAINDHELYITNDHFFRVQKNPLLAQIETYGAIPGGSVVHVNTKTETIRVLARLPFPNGIAMLNGTTLAVASTTRPAVYFYTIDPETHDLTYVKQVRTPFLPDNLSVDSKGRLLVSGHAHAKSMYAFKNTRPFCRSKDGAGTELCKNTVSPTWVAEWSEEHGLTDLFVGTQFSTGSTAVRDPEKGVGIVSGLYEDGILVWRD